MNKKRKTPRRRYLSRATRNLIYNAVFLTTGAVALATFTGAVTWGSGAQWVPIDAYLIPLVMVLSALALACFAAALLLERRLRARILAATAPPAAADVVEVNRGSIEGLPGPLAAAMVARRPAAVAQPQPVVDAPAEVYAEKPAELVNYGK